MTRCARRRGLPVRCRSSGRGVLVAAVNDAGRTCRTSFVSFPTPPYPRRSPRPRSRQSQGEQRAHTPVLLTSSTAQPQSSKRKRRFQAKSKPRLGAPAFDRRRAALDRGGGWLRRRRSLLSLAPSSSPRGGVYDRPGVPARRLGVGGVEPLDQILRGEYRSPLAAAGCARPRSSGHREPLPPSVRWWRPGRPVALSQVRPDVPAHRSVSGPVTVAPSRIVRAASMPARQRDSPTEVRARNSARPAVSGVLADDSCACDDGGVDEAGEVANEIEVSRRDERRRGSPRRSGRRTVRRRSSGRPRTLSMRSRAASPLQSARQGLRPHAQQDAARHEPP